MDNGGSVFLFGIVHLVIGLVIGWDKAVYIPATTDPPH
jgi:hypothetical protein